MHGLLARCVRELGEDELREDQAAALAEALGEPLEPARGEEALRPLGDGGVVARERGAQRGGVVGRVRLDQQGLFDLVHGAGDGIDGELFARADRRHEARACGERGRVGDVDAAGDLAGDAHGGVERGGVVGRALDEAGERLERGRRAELLFERDELPQRARPREIRPEDVGLGAEGDGERGVRAEAAVELLEQPQRRHVAGDDGDEPSRRSTASLGVLSARTAASATRTL